MQIHLIDNLYFVMEDTRYHRYNTYISPKKKMAEQKKQIAKNTQTDRFKYASR